MRGTIRRRVSLLAPAACAALAIAAAAAATSPADPTARAAAPVKVSMGDSFFAPVKAKVAVGGKVKWTNNGQINHNVTFPGGFASGNVRPGAVVVRKFSRAGKFAYSCTLHAGMTGKVKVAAP